MVDNIEDRAVGLTLRKKLEIIKGCLGVPQTELAHRLMVTPAAFSRWWKGRARPHPRKLDVIEDLLHAVTGCRENFFERAVSTKPKK